MYSSHFEVFNLFLQLISYVPIWPVINIVLFAPTTLNTVSVILGFIWTPMTTLHAMVILSFFGALIMVVDMVRNISHVFGLFLDINECLSNPCSDNCTENSPGQGYQCSCEPGKKLDVDLRTCIGIRRAFQLL